jgi:predicted DNA-binding transcriptional regulator AlpA
MAYPAYLREKARTLRRDKQLTIDELAERLALSRSTIYYWVRDLPVPRKTQAEWPESARIAAARSLRRKYRLLREAAYGEGNESFAVLASEPTFRDFVTLFLAEGYKRTRNRVSVANSDPAVLKVCQRWMQRLSEKRLTYWIQYHADQDLAELSAFWGAQLDIDPSLIRFQRKSNSNGLAARTWRSQYGVLTISWQRHLSTFAHAGMDGSTS